MVDPLPPLLPWKLVVLGLLLLAAVSGWRLDWDPFAEGAGQGRGALFPSTLPDREDGRPAVLFLGNSRLWLCLSSDGDELLDLAGFPKAQFGLLGGPFLRLSAIPAEVPRLVRFRPSVVVVQADLLLPPRDLYAGGTPIERLAAFESSGFELVAGLELLGRLGADRVVVVDLPLPEGVARELGGDWRAARALALGELAGRDLSGLEVVPAGDPWPDALFDADGVHFDPIGARELRRWLATRIAERPPR